MERDKISKMGRRRFTKTLAGLGVPATTIEHLTKDDFENLVDDVTEEVPFVARLRHTNHDAVRAGAAPEREPVYDSISRDRWIRVEAAHDAAKTIQQQIDTHEGSSLVRATVTTLHSSTGAKEKAIEVQYVTQKRDLFDPDTGSVRTVARTPKLSFDAVEQLLPSTVQGTAGDGRKPSWTVQNIPVFASQVERVKRSCKTYYYDDAYSGIPGGCKFVSGSPLNESRKGTFCTPAHKNDTNERHMVTAGHLLHDANGNTFNKVYQPSNGNLDPDGYTEEWIDDWGPNDYGYVRSDDNHTGTEQFKYRLAEDDGTYKSWEIQGIESWSTIKFYEGDSSFTVYNQGAKSGTNSGHITNTKEDYYGANWVETNIDGDEGDSGGPFFTTYEDHGYAYIVGVHTEGPSTDACPDSGSHGNHIGDVENAYNLTV